MGYLNLLFIASLVFSNLYAGTEKFDSADSILIEARIDQGKIISNHNYPDSIKYEIESQLMYTVGQLNGEEGGSPDMAKTTVNIIDVKKISDNNYEVTYSAHLHIAWPKELVVPETYKFILPKEGNSTFLYKFLENYGPESEGSYNCLDYSAHEVGTGNLWYYYRPQKKNCPLSKEGNSDSLIIEAKFKVSEENTSNKFPEYQKIWEDNKLVATLIFGMNEPEKFQTYDAGVQAFLEMIQLSLQNFGTLIWSNIEGISTNYVPKDKERIVHLKFKNSESEVDIMLILVNEIRRVTPGSAIEQAYQERTLISDFISYNGHSGLGANIRKLTQMGSFSPNQYQIFMVNGCDTFAYIDHSLANAHALVNPGYAPTKFFDMITNAMPSYFSENANNNLVILNSLLEKKKNYREILDLVDDKQRASVVGEEDNQWPLPFLP